MVGTVTKSVQLWEKDLVVPLFTSLKLASGSAEHAKFSETPSCKNDHSLGGIPFFNPSVPCENGPVICSHCQINLGSRLELVSHFNEDWHRVNIQRRMDLLPPINEETFKSGSYINDAEQPDIDTDGDSDFEEDSLDKEDIVMKKTSRVYFENADKEVVSIFRCVIMSKNEMVSEENLVLHATAAINKLYWCIVLMSGGHFAGAVYKGNQIIVHKTFHSYTVRAKQGGSQSSRDNKNATSHPKSAGASLRRYNEKSFAQHVETILGVWKDHFESCHLIFLQCSSNNKKLLFGQSSVLLASKDDPRIRSIPIMTKKPTMVEVKKVHDLLGQIVIHGSVSEFAKFVEENNCRAELKLPIDAEQKSISISLKSQKKEKVKLTMAEKSSIDTSFSNVDSDSSGYDLDIKDQIGLLNINSLDSLGSSVEDSRLKRKRKKEKNLEICMKENEVSLPELQLGSDLQLIHDKVYTACRLGEVGTLHAFIQLNESRDFTQVEDYLTMDLIRALASLDYAIDLFSLKFGNVEKTPLHIAAENGQKDLIWWLLEMGCDPCVIDKREKTPYMVSSTKDVRTIFRKFRGEFPEKYDYIAAHIADPISRETEELQKAKVLEKKKKQNKLKKERQKEKKNEEKRAQQEESEKEKFLLLSDREKRALAAERRIINKANCENVKDLLQVSRCFQCGKDISSIVPFEYLDYKFCATSCVRLHRLKT